MKNICVIGLGFVGLTTAVGLAQKGNNVLGFDINKEKTNLISDKKAPFYEEGLEEALNRNLYKNFNLSSSASNAVQNSDIIMLCVGTPSDENGKADLKYIKSAIDEILIYSKPEDKKIIVIKSTIPPSTTKKDIVSYIENNGFKVGKDIYLANNPEFLREGHAWSDFIEPDRIVIGTDDEYVKDIMQNVYENFKVPVHFVTLNTGEFIKYLSNTFLATLISYSNEMSMIADKIGGIDIKSAFKIFHEDKRWFGNPANMASYAYPGCGFGGYCLPKDTLALIQKANEFGYNSKILQSVIDVNKDIKPHWIEKIKQEIPIKERITILGLSFKPESDDIRQTPSLDIIKLLLNNGYKNILAYDPMANDLFNRTYGLPIQYAENFDEAVNYSDNIILITAWNEFIKNKDLFKCKKIYDLRYTL